MRYVLTGHFPYRMGECVLRREGAVLARLPVKSRAGFELVVHSPPGRAVIEQVVDGAIQTAHILTLGQIPDIAVPEMTPGTTLRALAWRETFDAGMGDAIELVEELLTDPVAEAVFRADVGRTTRELILRAFRVAADTRGFTWSWKELDAGVNAGLSTALRMVLTVAVWRSALRLVGVDRGLLRTIEVPATQMEMRACQLGHVLLSGPLLEDEATIPDPASRPLTGWAVAVLFALRKAGGLDPLRVAATCSEVSIAFDRALDDVVSAGLAADTPGTVVRALMALLAEHEAQMRTQAGPTASHIPGGWHGVAALWFASLTQLGFNEDVELPTESYTGPKN